MVRFRRERGPKCVHKAVLWGMFVRPEHRGRGIGRRLLEGLLALARAVSGLEQIKLTVNPVQESAIHGGSFANHADFGSGRPGPSGGYTVSLADGKSERSHGPR
jgi:GNAT superfamily N-acetyltransferase